MTRTGQARHPAVDAAMRTASTLTGMEVVFVGLLDDGTFVFDEILGTLPGLACGQTFARSDTLCARMLAGAPRATSDAARHPAYADAPAREVFGITSYVGVPIRDRMGRVVGTLCGVDRGEVVVDERVLGVLEELANIVGRYVGPEGADDVDPLTDAEAVRAGPSVRRAGGRWIVDGHSDSATPNNEAETLIEAIVLADLLTSDLPLPSRPSRPVNQLDEVDRLRLTVSQLEHALTTRVLIEQAIGVLTERLRASPRDAFERLRFAARTQQRRLHDLARDVIDSATDHEVELPAKLRGGR